MATARLLTSVLIMLAATPWLGCATGHNVAPAQPTRAGTASPASPLPTPEPLGAAELQAPSGALGTPPTSTAEPAPSLPPLTSPAPDAVIAVRPDGTKVTAAQIAAHAAPSEGVDAGDDAPPPPPATIGAPAPPGSRN